MKQQLKMIVEKLQENSGVLLNSGNQLSEMSQQIANETNIQATLTEDVITTMENILTIIHSNYQEAQKTSEISSDISKKINQNKSLLLKRLSSIKNINEKITIINEIADKTDILAINAASEVARMGDAGHGFSVVSQETRKLADKTKLISTEINALSVRNITVAEISSKLLKKLIVRIEKNAKYVNNFVGNEKEQEIQISSVTDAILQHNNAVNSNSASAEEMSASAEKLTAQAEQLKQLVSIFKIGKN